MSTVEVRRPRPPWKLVQEMCRASARNNAAKTIKAKFRERGMTIKEWAVTHGFPQLEVYRVLNGQNKAYRGQGHQIAVALGLKPDPNKQVKEAA